MTIKHWMPTITSIVLFGLFPCSRSLEAPSRAPAKKLIESGWDTPFPQALHDQLPQWQDRPFDGIVFSLDDNGGDIFNLKDYDPATLENDEKLVTGLHWGRFTDNFLLLKSESNMNWTSDADWKIVLAHVSMCAKIARAAGCKGFVLDPEPYGGTDPWDYRLQPQDKLISFVQYSTIVRQRGSEFVRVLQREVPDMKLLSYYQYSELLREVGPISNKGARDQALSTNGYGLLPSFLDGMLAASNPQVEFIDGNEPSYYFQAPTAFTSAYRTVRNDSCLYAASDLQMKYAHQERAANAVYSDYVFNLRPSLFPNNISIRMSPDQRNHWFQSNLYYALKTSDEYVWLYSETLHWWPPEDPRPPGMEDSIRSVKTKIDKGQPLGFNVSSVTAGANIKKVLARIGL